MIDLRSDTVTRPSPEMKRAMCDAELGDDVLGDDPTVKLLEARVAELLGKEAAVFMPSGTMTNQAAIRAHTEPGDEVLIESDGHVYYYEAGAPAAFAGVMCRLIDGDRGVFTADQVRACLRPRNHHFPPTRLLCLENTHNRGGGRVWPYEQYLETIRAGRDAGLAVHLDGARLWNAAVASDVPERTWCQPVDSVSVCFSKGLGAPIGSALAGTDSFIERARRFRKMMGGAMRQAGMLAAAALYAIDHHRQGLAQDHANARTLAQGLAAIDGVEIDPARTETNIVVFRTPGRDAAALAKAMGEAGVGMLSIGPDALRAVTHRDVSAEQIDQAVRAAWELLSRACGTT